MAIPISIDRLLNENIVEWARIEFKESWNPDATLKTISAFALYLLKQAVQSIQSHDRWQICGRKPS